MAALHTRRRKQDIGLAELVPEWRVKARALGLTREKTALTPPRPIDPLTGERVSPPRIPPPDLPANAIRSMKRAPALPRLPRDGSKGLSRVNWELLRSPSRAELSREPELGVLEAVARAVSHASERRTVLPEAEVRAVALGHAPGRYTLAEVDAAIERLVRGGELIEVERRGMDRAFVTDRAVKAERRVLAAMRAGRGKGMALANGETVEKRLDGTRLTRGQKEAVRAVLLADDLVIGVQGDAGSGKTTMLHEVSELLGERRIHGLAPSAVAARVLQREAGIPTRTLQYFLTRFGDLSDPEGLARGRAEYGRGVLAVDEAAMIDTVRMEELLRIAARLGVARVALVGDTEQLRPVDAGQPFRLLQKAGMATATMDEVVRQRDRELLLAVLLSREGEPGAAIEGLGDRVREAPREELGHEAAMYWLALPPEERDDTLLLAPTHTIRRQANEVVRAGLEREGTLHGRTLEIDRLVDRRLTRAQASDIGSYEPGDIAVFHRDHYGCRRDDICTVIGIEESRVVLAHPDGKERRFQPSGNAAWYLRICDTERIELRAGDRIRWTRNREAPPGSFGHPRAPDLVNGGEAEIVEIDYRRVRFRDGEGSEFNLALTDPQLRHLDHAYCSTVHAAQGRTAHAAIAVLDAGGAADRQLFHVELSRVSDRFLLLTDDREALIELLEARPGFEDGALEALGVDPAEIPAVDLEVFCGPGRRLAGSPARGRRDGDDTLLPCRVRGRDGTGGGTVHDRGPAGRHAPSHRHHAGGARGASRARPGGEEPDRADPGELARWPEFGWAASAQGCAVEELPQYGAWREEGTALLEEARTRLDADGDAARHLQTMPGGSAGLAGAVEALDRTRFRDEAILGFEARLREVNEQARAADTIPSMPKVMAPSSSRLGRSLSCRTCPRAMRQRPRKSSPMPGLREPAHEDRSAARKDGTASRRALGAGEPCCRQAPRGLGDYAAWWNRCQAAKRNWQGMLGDQDTWRPHLDRLGEEAAAIETTVDRFVKLRGHDLFDVSMKGIEEAAQAARGRGILPFHDDACCEAVDEAKRLAGKHELDEEARRRLQAVLEEEAARAAEWMVVVRLLRDMGSLGRRECQLEIDAEQREVPRTELSGWEKLQEEIGRFTDVARAALDDGTLQAHWESHPDIRASIEKGLLDWEGRPDIRASIEKGLLDWESRLDVRASIEKGLPETEAGVEVAHERSVPVDDFPIKCKRDTVLGDLLRWTEVVEPRSWGSGESDRAGREEVVQFEGGLVGRTAEKYERKDCCTVEVYSRSDDGPLGKMSLSFDTLIGGGGGCWRAYWPAEAIRSEEARKQNRELKESREIVWRSGPRWSMTR